VETTPFFITVPVVCGRCGHEFRAAVGTEGVYPVRCPRCKKQIYPIESEARKV